MAGKVQLQYSGQIRNAVPGEILARFEVKLKGAGVTGVTLNLRKFVAKKWDH